jgi:hypothetical protein
MPARFLRIVFLLLPIVGCNDADDESLDALFAEQDELSAEIGQAECDSKCAMASPINGCESPLDVSDEPLDACERDALALDTEGVRAWSDCWLGVETEFLECLQSPTCGETSDYLACRDERQAGHDTCEFLPVEVENALEICWGESEE